MNMRQSCASLTGEEPRSDFNQPHSSRSEKCLLQQARADGAAHRGRLAVDLELVVNAADVTTNGVDRDAELVGRGLIAEAFGEECKQADLLVRERRRALLRGRRAPQSVDYFTGDLRRHGGA